MKKISRRCLEEICPDATFPATMNDEALEALRVRA
jgi:hypothetical protein